ncbi:uncharacterized protein B0H18DRAFT_976083 [Fomitopsis serialis]|uniref:uncharacterized protein n=1 Tax=Fomitopsis serialis TaxID=139415 RepID=UPI002008D0E2|nr:uncharacterized protein B0H18DRAFT_976083 [Neoantrodia serialis]KAH9935521.1 hypothetical protein B0H18DRAFT_976083 [Neoantrodia serialis]
MKLLYPASHEIPQLSDELLAVKIARHSSCSACSSCPGLRPPPGVEVVLASDAQPGSSPSESQGHDGIPGKYLDGCACGHGIVEHGANLSSIGAEEFARRGRAAVRLDELLEDVNKLLDFDYADDDIDGLRRQMTLPARTPSPASSISDALNDLVPSSPNKAPSSPASSFLSDAADVLEPPTKKRRVSFSESSLSSSSSDDDEEDRPLAARKTAAAPATAGKTEGSSTSRVTGQKRSGKQPSNKKAKKTQARTAPVSMIPPSESQKVDMTRPADGANGEAKVKVEDKMDEGQLMRLATGVTVDATGPSSGTPTFKPEKMAHVELRKGIIKVVPIENDREPRSLVILTGLKTLFQKQLPKMPREYIARLVYDTNSKCLAIIKRGYKVVGGICYRPFPHRGFAEITFFATTSVDQVKGYGSMLMDHFKAHIKNTYSDMWHFLTYADNYAVGYFRKQGFSKEITLDRSVWAGYIKDYEGGTIMQCTMLDRVDYLNTREILLQQREAILGKIREMSRSHIVYDGLPQFQEGASEEVTVDPKDVPGLRESGWTPSMMTGPVRSNGKGAEHNLMEKLLSDLSGHTLAWPFQLPVNADEVPDYYEVIKQPMDFSTMEHKLDTNQYPSLDAFLADAQLVFDNCRIYNPEGTIYYKNSLKLEKFLKDQLAAYRVKKED